MKYRERLACLKNIILEETLPLLFFFLHQVFFWSLFITAPVLTVLCYIWPKTIYYLFGYFLWTRYDSHTLMTDGRKWHCLKYLLAFDCLRNYFSLRLIKTVDLSPSQNYIFACFPHAVVPFGALLNLALNTNNVTQIFPLMDIRMATLNFLFSIPLVREYFMAAGACTRNEQNIRYLLNSKPCKAVMIFPGGTKEYYISRSGNECKIIKSRKGFIRIALQTGSPLVPVFTFNEHNVQNQEKLKSPILNYLSEISIKYTGMGFNKVIGRGFFQKKFGILPHRVPLTTVVGEPIPVPKVENPSAELVDEYKEKFYKALYDLFEKNKVKYDRAGNEAKLIMEDCE